jgi:hypothetical protein
VQPTRQLWAQAGSACMYTCAAFCQVISAANTSATAAAADADDVED